jgi:hypothetical protein
MWFESLSPLWQWTIFLAPGLPSLVIEQILHKSKSLSGEPPFGPSASRFVRALKDFVALGCGCTLALSGWYLLLAVLCSPGLILQLIFHWGFMESVFRGFSVGAMLFIIWGLGIEYSAGKELARTTKANRAKRLQGEDTDSEPTSQPISTADQSPHAPG